MGCRMRLLELTRQLDEARKSYNEKTFDEEMSEELEYTLSDIEDISHEIIKDIIEMRNLSEKIDNALYDLKEQAEGLTEFINDNSYNYTSEELYEERANLSHSEGKGY